MKLTTSIVCVAILIFAIFVPAAAASTPQDVTIVSDMSALPNGTFEATGPAVEAGILCPAGTVHDESVSAVGGQSPVSILFVHKHFECNDGSGSFEMDLNVRIASSGTLGRWLVVSGSGDYERLHGEGAVYATYTDTGLYDTYTGKLDVH